MWSEFLAQVEDDLHPRATVIVLGDARTNGRDPRADIFATIAARAGRTFWLNPEPRLYWNYGDSVISAYEQYCTAFECWTHRPARGLRARADTPGGGRRAIASSARHDTPGVLAGRPAEMVPGKLFHRRRPFEPVG